MPIYDHVFGKEPKLDIQIIFAAALNKLGGKLIVRPEHLQWAKGDVHWTLAPNLIRVRLIHRRWARAYRVGRSRVEDTKAYLAVALARLGGEMVVTGADLQFEAGDIGYLMQKKGQTFDVRLTHNKGEVTTVGAQGAGPSAIVIARA